MESRTHSINTTNLDDLEWSLKVILTLLIFSIYIMLYHMRH